MQGIQEQLFHIRREMINLQEELVSVKKELAETKEALKALRAVPQTIPQVAEILKVSKGTIYNRLKEGLIEPTPDGKITWEDIDVLRLHVRPRVRQNQS